jgi:hypothetical protein
VKQAWYAVFRHGRGNPDTRFAVTYTCSHPLSTLPADGTLALERPPRGGRQIWRWPDTWYRSGLRRTWVRLGERGRRDRFGTRMGIWYTCEVIEIFEEAEMVRVLWNDGSRTTHGFRSILEDENWVFLLNDVARDILHENLSYDSQLTLVILPQRIGRLINALAF